MARSSCRGLCMMDLDIFNNFCIFLDRGTDLMSMAFTSKTMFQIVFTSDAVWKGKVGELWCSIMTLPWSLILTINHYYFKTFALIPLVRDVVVFDQNMPGRFSIAPHLKICEFIWNSAIWVNFWFPAHVEIHCKRFTCVCEQTMVLWLQTQDIQPRKICNASKTHAQVQPRRCSQMSLKWLSMGGHPQSIPSLLALHCSPTLIRGWSR